MKYTTEIIKTFIEALQDGAGRVRACQAANISYQCFLNWLEDPNKIEFFESVKKAESNGEDKIKDICKRRVIEDKSWQSAAWWLERKYKDEFAVRQDVNHSGEISDKKITVKYNSDELDLGT